MYFNDVRLVYFSMVNGQFGLDYFWITIILGITFHFSIIAWDSIEKGD